MTFAEFIAWALWPIAGLFAALLTTTRDPTLRRHLKTAAIGTSCVYFVLGFYWQSSIVGVMDYYLVGAMLCLAVSGYALLGLLNEKTPALYKLRLVVFLVLGVIGVWWSTSTLYSDYAEPRLVIEGQVDSVREMRSEYFVYIGHEAVKATKPVFERLKSKPYVRVEVGRGSNYIFNIEYLNR